MFKFFNHLPDDKKASWPHPSGSKEWIEVCRESGRLAGNLCKYKEKKKVDYSASQFHTCDYHKVTWTTKDSLRIDKICVDVHSVKDTLFVLTPVMDYYYSDSHPQYKGWPSSSPSCTRQPQEMKFMYPFDRMKIFLPRENMEKKSPLICQA